MARRQLSHRDQGSSTLSPARTWISGQGLVFASLAGAAFACYYLTLLPGLDLGDSASFQTGVGHLTLTPRQAYPLYYGIGSVFVWLHPGEPARALNFASAVYGALAVGMAGWATSKLVDSLVAGIAAGLFLAFSYTFWTQAVTAEVYTLHLLVTGAALVALLAWAEGPTLPRLAWFYALYALGFGNHLSTILLLPGFALYVLIERRPGRSDPLRPANIALALVIAALGALQYAWNFRGLWGELEAPESLAAAVNQFWFDVTKADWRQTLVMSVSDAGLKTRHLMYWFDLRQQFGMPGIALAVTGLAYVVARWPSRGVLLIALFAANLAFAWTYNVGDAYIFFLPSHYVLALCAGAGVGAIVALAKRLSNRTAAAAAALLLLAYPAWRGYDTFPAVDRSRDNRAVELLARFTSWPRDAVFGVDHNWQVQNAVEYFMHEHRPGVAWFATDAIQWMQWKGARDRFDALVRANVEAGRDVVVTPRVYDKVRASASEARETWGLTPVPVRGSDPSGDGGGFSDRVRATAPGTPYVLAVLRPDREYALNTIALAGAWTWLTRGVPMPALGQYNVVVGRAGQPPELVQSADRPYRVRVRIEPLDVDVRMESWLPTDTIRRAGFGHVVVNGRHELTIERGISFQALDPGGEAIYESGLFARVPQVLLAAAPR